MRIDAWREKDLTSMSEEMLSMLTAWQHDINDLQDQIGDLEGHIENLEDELTELGERAE